MIEDDADRAAALQWALAHPLINDGEDDEPWTLVPHSGDLVEVGDAGTTIDLGVGDRDGMWFASLTPEEAAKVADALLTIGARVAGREYLARGDGEGVRAREHRG